MTLFANSPTVKKMLTSSESDHQSHHPMGDQQPQFENENANEWIRFGMKLAAQSLLHPFEYSKILMQVHKQKVFPTFQYQFFNYLFLDRFRTNSSTCYNHYFRQTSSGTSEYFPIW